MDQAVPSAPRRLRPWPPGDGRPTHRPGAGPAARPTSRRAP